MFPQKHRALLPLLFFLLCLSPCGASQEASVVVPLDNIWANVDLAGQPSGYYHEKTERDKDGKILTSVEMVLIINRLESRVKMRTSYEYIESENARLISLRSKTSSSKQSTLMEVTVDNGFLLVRTTSGGRSYDRKVPFVGTLLGPEAIRRRGLAELKSPGDTMSYQTFLPELGSVVTAVRRVIGTEQLLIDKEQMSSLRVEDTIEKLPAKTTVWLDSNGRFLRQVQDSPFGETEVIRTAHEPTQTENQPSVPLPEEAYTRTLARANIRLPHERSIERMKIRIMHRKPELGWPDLEADNQKVLEKTPNSLVLEIWRPELKTKELRPVKSSPELAPFLEANPLLQSDDTGVQSILGKVAGINSDVFSSALALQKWTAENMRFDTGIAVASASEVARDRRGTCFGYSVLLGSLARAAGIPSRFKMGYVYASGIWGGHAWVEVLVGDDWIPIDAAAYFPGVADAARFSAFASSLEEGLSMQMGALMQLYGNLDIRILEYTLKGRRVSVPVDAKSYSANDNTYRNPWLGLTVVKPGSFRFTKLDAVWPDVTIVAMEGPNHQTVGIQKLPYSPLIAADLARYLQQAGITGDQKDIRVSGFPGLEMDSPGDAGLSFVNEDEVWIVRAKGIEASSWLHKVASRMELSH